MKKLGGGTLSEKYQTVLNVYIFIGKTDHYVLKSIKFLLNQYFFVVAGVFVCR
jgi:hypothetical protein